MSRTGLAIVGCGYVFDIYMRTRSAYPEHEIVGVYDINADRLASVCAYYNLRPYSSLEEVLADSAVGMVVNLTSIASHYEVSSKCLAAGKHVYTEKPIAVNIEETKNLFRIAEEHNVRLYSAPCNLYSDSVRTLLHAARMGCIGKPRLVYAELDDNPIHLMNFEGVRSPSGAPWPLDDEIREGCTFEHLGYHLVWICALFGPAVSVTAYSAELLDGKSQSLPGKSGTPDYSVACLTFSGGESARITCSVVAPRDHRMRVIGTEGELSVDTYRHFQCAVNYEKFTSRSLNGRKLKAVVGSRILSRVFGIGGRPLRLRTHAKSFAIHAPTPHANFAHRAFERIRRSQTYAQDKFLGVHEMILDLETGRQPLLDPNFFLHVNELTLLVQNAGPTGITATPTTTFSPIQAGPEFP